MIITNSVIKVKQKFRSKDDIKSYLYSFIGKHPFRQYNQKKYWGIVNNRLRLS